MLTVDIRCSFFCLGTQRFDSHFLQILRIHDHVNPLDFPIFDREQESDMRLAECSSEIDHSNPTWTQPGSSYLLIGRQDTPVQLNIDQLDELVKYLQGWLETAKLAEKTLGSPMRTNS